MKKSLPSHRFSYFTGPDAEDEEELDEEVLMKKIDAEDTAKRQIEIMNQELTKHEQNNKELCLIVEAAGSRA